MNDASPGILYLVSTPIGNLEDISARALRILKEADLIAAEDTRHTGILLKQYDFSNRMASYHDFNKRGQAGRFVQRLLAGETIALVTDAGTPGISDPAFVLVREAVKAQINIVPVPGPTAAIAGLTVSGLPTDRFVFEGFLPAKKGRKTRLEALSREPRTIILYEAPHRLIRTLGDLKAFWGNRNIAVCRELTKKFEEIRRGSIEEILEAFSEKNIRGEFVLIIEGCGKDRRNR